jgi:hypothetical protein
MYPYGEKHYREPIGEHKEDGTATGIGREEFCIYSDELCTRRPHKKPGEDGK